jgi:two-component system response regulator FlrC
LSKLVGAGRFYRALFLYLSYHQISLVPLRERKDDIHFLADLYLEDFARMVGSLKPLINEEALDKLKTFYWPHNLED